MMPLDLRAEGMAVRHVLGKDVPRRPPARAKALLRGARGLFKGRIETQRDGGHVQLRGWRSADADEQKQVTRRCVGHRKGFSRFSENSEKSLDVCIRG